MKKFTGNFLVGGYRRSLRIFRSFALGLIALMWTHTAAFAQPTCEPPGGTVYFMADSIDVCYNGDNLYKVNVSVKDFENVDSLNLFLDYAQAYWNFVGFTILEEGLFDQTNSGPLGTNEPLTVTNDAANGVLNIEWAEWVTRGTLAASEGTEVPILELEFSLKNYPNNSSFPYVNALVWTTDSKVYTCGGADNFDLWTNVAYVNGAVETDVVYDTFTYTLDPEQPLCSNLGVEVTITDPVGADLEYSFNGQSYTSGNTANAAVGMNSVQILNTETQCLSKVMYFEIEGPEPLEFTTIVTDESCDRQGEIEIHVVDGTGTAPFTYWIVPEANMATVLYTLSIKGKNDPSLAPYKTSSNQILRPAGNYLVAVDDANGCVDLTLWASEGEGDWSWQPVFIEPGENLTYDITEKDTVTCFNGEDGEITISDLTGGYPWAGGYYNVFIAGVVDTLVTSETGMVVTGLEVGAYEVIISDSLCSKTETVNVYNAETVSFYVAYTDAPCSAATGTLWVSEFNGEPLEAAMPGWFYRVVGPGVDTVVAVGDTLEGIAANYYSAWLIDSVNLCPAVAFDNEDGSGNIVPILDNGAITFTPVVTDEVCFGDNAGTISVKDITRSCPNCNEGAVYEFRVDSGEWMAATATATGYTTGDTVLVEVRDAADPDVCIVGKIVVVDGPDEELTATVSMIVAPTCAGGNDGWVRMNVTGGVKPYSYSVDNMPNWRPNPSFGLTEGEHILRVKDDNGCLWSETIMVEYLSGIEITASIEPIECNGDKNPISVVIDTFTNYPDFTDYTYYYSVEDGDPVVAGTSFIPEELEAGAVKATLFGAGTYYVVAKDPNGCFSDVDTIVLEDVPALEVAPLVVEPATCDGTWSGRVTITVLGGNAETMYEYAVANNKDVFINPNSDINWVPFVEGDTAVSQEMQEGTYWIVVRDDCEQSEPQQAIIKGFAPIDIIANDLEITDVTCYGEADGELVVPAEAVTGGAPGGYDGLGGEGATGNYLYTLWHRYDADGETSVDTIVGDAQQVSNTFSNLVAGEYMLYVYDTTDPDADPAQCTPDSALVVVEQPEMLVFETMINHVSCTGAEDGEIYVSIMGGTGGTWNIDGQPTAAKTDGNKYSVTINQITGDGDYSLQLGDAIDTVVFQVMGGDFEIVVEDAHGCIYKDTVEVYEPEAWVIKPLVEEPSDCNMEDGVIEAVVTGGYEGVPVWVEYSYDGNTFEVDTVMSGDTVLVSDSAVYLVDYLITVGNVEAELDFALADDQCTGSTTVTFAVVNPFEFDVAIQCVKCYGEDNGKVTFSNITGGSGKYQIQLVGGENDIYDAENEDLWWPKKANGDALFVNTSIVFDTLTAGEYWVYVRDDAGFTLANCCRPVKFEMCQPDSLELVSVTLVSNVACYGDSTGAISIQATGGEAPYQYTYTRTEVGEGHPYIGVVPDDAVWYTDSVITGLPVGTYIGWVKDANGCISGCEIDNQGAPIDEHRVVVLDAGAVVVDSVYVEEPGCYEGVGEIELWGVTGGAGDSLTFELEGKTYTGMDTTYTFGPWKAGLDVYTLAGVYASDEDGYVLTLATDLDCASAGDTIVVGQPDVFSVVPTIMADGLCVGDVEVLISLVVEGGTAPFTFDIYKDGVLHRDNSTIVNHVLTVGSEYVVVATDALGCSVDDTLYIETPMPITFTADNLTCYGDTLASARINVVGTPGRTFQIQYKEIENDIAPSEWTVYNGWFDESVDMIQLFTYDSENLDDVHYAFKVIDDQGCESDVDTLTFDYVQHPLELREINIGEAVGCETPIDVVVSGGIPPYTLYINGEASADMTAILTQGAFEIMVADAHMRCVVKDTVEVVCNLPIADVQSMSDSSDYVGMEVQITGTVSAVADGGFFVQDAVAAWSGIWVESNDTVEIGDGVKVMGLVDEISDVTTMVASDVEVLDAAPVAITALVVLPEDVEDEMYESVLIQLEGVRAMAADTATGQWTVYTEDTIQVVINDWLYAYDTDSVVAGDFYDITGVVNGKLDTFTVEPRMVTDVVNLTKTTDVEVIPGETLQFKVYPNPFNDRIMIDNNDKLTRVVVSNIAGQRVIDIEYPSHEIRTANLVSGVYVVSLITEDGVAKTERMIKR